jgi:hypothetical protein
MHAGRALLVRTRVRVVRCGGFPMLLLQVRTVRPPPAARPAGLM